MNFFRSHTLTKKSEDAAEWSTEWKLASQTAADTKTTGLN